MASRSAGVVLREANHSAIEALEESDDLGMISDLQPNDAAERCPTTDGSNDVVARSGPSLLVVDFDLD